MSLPSRAEVSGEPHDTSGNWRRPDIQGLRAIAVLMVVLFHSRLPVPGGFVGVDVFFVISGFVITGMLHREWQQTGRIRFGNFYLRRFKRLMPALAIMVAVVMVISAVVLSPLGAQQTAAKTGIAAILSVANFVIAGTTGGYFDAPAETNPLLNTWSLSVEEQFYLVFPALIALGWSRSRRRWPRWLGASFVVAVVAVVSFALAVAGSWGFTMSGFDAVVLGFYSPFSRAWEFAVGALLALALSRGPLGSSRLGSVAGLVGLGLLVISMWTITESTPYPGLWTMLPVAGTLLLLTGGQHPEAFTTRLLSTNPLTKIGDWSYSIYLWHWPFIVFALYLWPKSPLAGPMAAGVALIPAIVSYRWVEGPSRRLPSMSRAKTTLLVAAVVVPTVALAGVVGGVATSYWMPKVASGERSIYRGDVGKDDYFRYTSAHFYPCTPEYIRRSAPNWGGVESRCLQSQATGPVEVAIVGDSHADHLFVGLAEAFPGVNVATYLFGVPVRSVNEDLDRLIDYIVGDPHIKTVIVNSYWAHAGVPGDRILATLKELRSAGKSVFLTDDVPGFPFDPQQCRDGKGLLITVPGDCTVDEFAYEGAFDTYADELRTLVAGAPGVRLLETFRYFCTSGSCSMTSGENLLYRDDNHLNLNGSRFVAAKLALVDEFSAAMKSGSIEK